MFCSVVSALFLDCFGCVFGSSDYQSHTDVAVGELLSIKCSNYAEQSRELRSMFAEMEIVRRAAVTGHTHGESAAARTSASAFIDTLAASTGRRAVFLQGSAADSRNGREFTRVHYWGKDWNVGPRQLSKEDEDLTAMVDVDAHVDMRKHLASNFRPLTLYTAQPVRAGTDRGEYKYCFDLEGNLDYTVSGGGHYIHPVWNWEGDSVAATRTFCCIPLTRSVFNIERKAVDADHQLVLLTPLVKFRGLWAWIAKSRSTCHELKRLNPIDEKGFVRLQVNTQDGLTISTGKVGGYLSANVPASVDEAIASAARTSTKLTHGMVKAKMAVSKTEVPDSKETVGSEVLLEYHLTQGTTCERVDSMNHVRAYQWVRNYQDLEPENPAMTSFMRPLVDGAFVPDSSKNNDLRMREERVLKLKEYVPKDDEGANCDDESCPCNSSHPTDYNMLGRHHLLKELKSLNDNMDIKQVLNRRSKRALKQRAKKPKLTGNEPPTGLLEVVIGEFMEKFKDAIGGGLRPVDEDVVYERQPRPTQRRILDEAQHGAANSRGQGMQKNEAYPNLNDPRVITAINGKDKLEYSAYMYALADRIKRLPWYAFGKTPKQIAERVAALCEGCTTHIDSTDFSRMDGRVAKLARYLEQRLMLAVYHKDYHLELLKLMKAQTFLKVSTKHGVSYNSGYARASGSPETSVFNTILNAFIAFLTFRMTKFNGRFYNKHEAWALLGMYGGDDGLTPDQDGEAAEKAASMMGQVMTVDRTMKGDSGVSFLARCYGPDVWWGDANSCCDIKRQLSKFHVTQKLSSKITPEIKLQEKAFAFSLTDSNTPVIGPFVTTALSLFPMNRGMFTNNLRIWNIDHEDSDHYPNEYADWMIDLLEFQLPDFDNSAFLDWIACVDKVSIFRAPPFMAPVPAKAKPGVVYVDGDFVVTEEKPITTPVRAKKHHRAPRARRVTPTTRNSAH